MSKRSAFYSQGESLVQQDEINTLTEKLAYMKIINMRDPRLSLSISNLVIGRKQTTIVNILCSVILSVFITGYSHAGTWRDDFDGNELNGWERIVEHNPWNTRWKVLGGILFSQIRKPREPLIPDKDIADFLQWTGMPFRLEQLTVIGTEIIYHQEGKLGMGELCLFLGKRRAVPHFAVEGYIFSPEETSRVTFTANGDYSRGKTKAWYGDKFPFTTRHLKVVFDSGEFKVFTNKDLLAEFIDARFTEIDVVGLLITSHIGEVWFGAHISSFSITGQRIINQNLAVQLKEMQFVMTWAHLKQFE